jgi:hypothetical protein
MTRIDPVLAIGLQLNGASIFVPGPIDEWIFIVCVGHERFHSSTPPELDNVLACTS